MIFELNIFDPNSSNIYNVEYSNVSSILDTNHKFPKKENITKVKIQLGLNCNYSCTYCLQDHSNSVKITKDFSQIIKQLTIVQGEYIDLELWGGEPFVYWKTIKPLIAELKVSDIKLRNIIIITNGSLLTGKVIDWIIDNDIFIGLSHDGPTQKQFRGKDPLDNIETLEFVKSQMLKGKLSLNTVLHAQHYNRRNILEWFTNRLSMPKENVILGEGFYIDIYNDDNMVQDNKIIEHLQSGLDDVQDSNVISAFSLVDNKINEFGRFITGNLEVTNMSEMSCGMDKHNVISIDLEGNITSCQNVDAKSIAKNGLSHKIGHINNLSKVMVSQTGTHFSKRPNCMSCAVLPVCKGGCMTMGPTDFEKTCTHKRLSYLPILSKVINIITEHTLVGINNKPLFSIVKSGN